MVFSLDNELLKSIKVMEYVRTDMILSSPSRISLSIAVRRNSAGVRRLNISHIPLGLLDRLLTL